MAFFFYSESSVIVRLPAEPAFFFADRGPGKQPGEG
jgi:hypothetical protein